MNIEVEMETDGRWIAEVPELPGVMSYGDTRASAVSRAEALALRIIADRLDHGECVPELESIFSIQAWDEPMALKKIQDRPESATQNRLVHQKGKIWFS